MVTSTTLSLAAAGSLVGTPVAVVGHGTVGHGTVGRHDEGPAGGTLAASAVRDALLDAGAAVATVGAGTPVPPGTRWVVDLAGLPAGEGPHGEETEPGLGPDSVLVVAGGGRGIGARAANALARAFGCGVELVGPDDEPSPLAGRGDATAVRRAILGRGELGRPGEIAGDRDRTLAAREVRRTLGDLGEHAAFAGYRCLDPGDAAALAAAIDDVRTRRGRLDGVVRVAEVRPDGGTRRATRTGAAPGEVA